MCGRPEDAVVGVHGNGEGATAVVEAQNWECRGPKLCVTGGPLRARHII